MTTVGQLTAKPPSSPYSNLVAVNRVGTTKSGSAIWRVQCSCGEALEANAPAIKQGMARCKTCNPSIGAAQERKILAVLPCGYAKLERKTKLTRPQLEYRIDVMRAAGVCHVGAWERADAQGSFCPIFHAGAGPDVPCDIKPFTDRQIEKRYQRRVRKAVNKALAGGPEDPRYMLHISRRKADKAVRNTRKNPQTWLSALMG